MLRAASQDYEAHLESVSAATEQASGSPSTSNASSTQVQTTPPAQQINESSEV